MRKVIEEQLAAHKPSVLQALKFFLAAEEPLFEAGNVSDSPKKPWRETGTHEFKEISSSFWAATA